MEHFYDEFSKSLAASVPRRESLRQIGAVFAGAVLGQLGLRTAWGQGPAKGSDPCKAFCHCGNKAQQNACLTACRNCNSNPTRLCGTCGSGYVCTDLSSVSNCGACFNSCNPGPYETAACIAGQCVYTCNAGAVNCSGTCTDLANDFNNCGACGARCSDPTPYEVGMCVEGVCAYECVPGAMYCGGLCIPVDSDPDNCGACGDICSEPTPHCVQGTCSGDAPCPGGGTFCNGVCTNISFDTLNCGACGVVCGDGQTCLGGLCQYVW